MNNTKSLLIWIDKNLLFFLSLFLLIFIPLFPKIPLFEVIPGYIVRARAEDVLVALTGIVWLREVFKQRISINNSYFWIVLAYTVSGIISIVLATLLIQSIPQQLLHIGKSGLHLFRYLEYFAVFFFAYSSIKTQRHLKLMLATIAVTIFGVVVYGFGQQYLNFPLYSTMNREYSKGVTLYLQEGARPQSTFAGHYDLAAYLVIVLPLIFSAALAYLPVSTKLLKSLTNPKSFSKTIKKLLRKHETYIALFFHLIHIAGAWMLFTSGSKTALFGYAMGIFIVIGYRLSSLGTKKQKLLWGSGIGIFFVAILFAFLQFFAPTTRDAFLSILRNNSLTGGIVQQISPAEITNRPEDLIGEGHEFKLIRTEQEDGTILEEWVPAESVWSPNAIKYGISMGIRLDELWPNALRGFVNQPLFGNGYATLATIDSFGEFTYAESTDNNFLRTLGETGILGFALFYGLIAVFIYELVKVAKSQSGIVQAVAIGFIASTIGLLINATYIDVFAASKVAYTYWAIAGIVIASAKIKPTLSISSILKHLNKHKSLYFSIFLLLVFLHRNPFKTTSPMLSLEVTQEQLDSLAAARCYVEQGVFAVCRNSGAILGETSSLYSRLLIPFYSLYNSVFMFYVLNIFLFIFALYIQYKLIPIALDKFTKQKIRETLLLGSLISTLLIYALLGYSNQPLTNIQLGIIFILIPLLQFVAMSLLHLLKYRLSYLVQISISLTILLLLINRNYDSQLLENYRNTTTPAKYTAVMMANTHVDTARYLNREQDFYFISNLPPLYVDFFSNNYYTLLPLTSQHYSQSSSQLIYEGLALQNDSVIETYRSLLPNNNLLVTNFETVENQEVANTFDLIKSEFDLKYVAVGCDDTCNLYQLYPEAEKVSPQPLSVSNKPFDPTSLNDRRYRFSVFPNTFEKRQINQKIGYSAQMFANFLNSNIFGGTDFAIVTGDVFSDNNTKNITRFLGTYTKTPLLFVPGNHTQDFGRLQPTSDAYFFTDSEFFLLLDAKNNIKPSGKQQLFIYNAFLELEKLEGIQTIFIISHDLNWEVDLGPDSLLTDLERKLASFPEQRKFIITNSHSTQLGEDISLTLPELADFMQEQSLKHVINEQTNTEYISASVRNWENDSFVQFTVNADETVTVDYRQKTPSN